MFDSKLGNCVFYLGNIITILPILIQIILKVPCAPK